MKILLKIQKLALKIRLPSAKKIEEAAQDLSVLAGFVMVLIGLWGFDYRLALVICGVWLMIPVKSVKRR